MSTIPVQDTTTTSTSEPEPTTPPVDGPKDDQQKVVEPENNSDSKVTSLITDALKEKSTAQSAANYESVLKEFNLEGDESKTISELLGKHSLSEDAAKDLLAYQQSAIEKAIEAGKTAQMEQINADFKSAQEKLIADCEKKFGDGLKEALSFSSNAINRVLDRNDADKFGKFLDETGLGNDPLMLDFMARVGKVFSEDKVTNGNSVPKQPLYPGTGLKME